LLVVPELIGVTKKPEPPPDNNVPLILAESNTALSNVTLAATRSPEKVALDNVYEEIADFTLALLKYKLVTSATFAVVRTLGSKAVYCKDPLEN